MSDPGRPQILCRGVILKGIGKLSFVAASAALSAAIGVQSGTKEFTTKDSGYDYKMNETINVVTAKTIEIRHMTLCIMRGIGITEGLRIHQRRWSI